MRIIDADELEKSLENYSNNHGLINAFVEFLNVVDEVPTLDVLDKIRAEIEALPHRIDYTATYVNEDDVKKIIDKYKAESEENE